ncbi:MAG: hypothetical protein A07HB70_00615 [uncultured archaeon A07HB70]|nr:MAG: hypothetical protein A07HB70_00615 [uncultured archaeon A07HB70]
MVTVRGQAYTLEAVVAGTILLATLVFASQAAAVTPLTASTSSQHIENQERAVAEGTLASATENESLVSTLLFYNVSEDTYYETDFNQQYAEAPPTRFGDTLESVFRDRGVAFNVQLSYLVGGEERNQRRLVYMGAPTDSAVSASRVVTLYDTDEVTEPNGSVEGSTGRTLANVTSTGGDSFYIDDVSQGPVYNLVEVEVTVWRM